jgi:S1-C subfamily serine protease
VVALKVSAVRSFDTSPAGVSQATGFVVDAKRGIILTNRHVVQPGPVDAEAVFLNHERVDVEAIYRDPVHDFGFFRYDPSSVQFMKPTELALAPGRSWPGPSRGSIARRPSTAAAVTATSTRSISRRRRAPREAPPDRRSSTSGDG